MADVSTLGTLTRTMEVERQKKHTSGLGNIQEIMKLFGPGYMKGAERTALAGINENMISRGLGSTTRPAAMSVQMKGEFEDMRRGKLADVWAMMADYKKQSAPTPGLISQTAQAANLALRSPGALGSLNAVERRPLQHNWGETPVGNLYTPSIPGIRKGYGLR